MKTRADLTASRASEEAHTSNKLWLASTVLMPIFFFFKAVVTIPRLMQPGRLLGGRRDGKFLEGKEQAVSAISNPTPSNSKRARGAPNKY